VERGGELSKMELAALAKCLCSRMGLALHTCRMAMFSFGSKICFSIDCYCAEHSLLAALAWCIL
jgi:hypothetical protein